MCDSPTQEQNGGNDTNATNILIILNHTGIIDILYNKPTWTCACAIVCVLREIGVELVQILHDIFGGI